MELVAESAFPYSYWPISPPAVSPEEIAADRERLIADFVD